MNSDTCAIGTFSIKGRFMTSWKEVWSMRVRKGGGEWKIGIRD